MVFATIWSRPFTYQPPARWYLPPATKANVQQLQSYGHHLIPVENGHLASGLSGPGRMAEPETIAAWLDHFFETPAHPVNIPPQTKALVTAGPTYEAIDPVRFIGNFSTGKMGIALAEALANRGIQVDLVLGPSKESTNHPLVTTHKVISAQEMYDTCERLFPETTIAILSAAVADFRPQEKVAEKIKKGSEDTPQLTLVKNPDILAHLGTIKQKEQTVIGFALETNNELEHAQKKLKAKNADMIILNSLQEAGAGFGHDTNKVTLLSADGTQTALPLQSKKEIAKSIVDCVLALKYNNA